MFIDETRLVVTSGNGGNGSGSFRREKYVERGGPDGGDGGNGGAIIFEVRRNLKTFAHLQNKHKFSAMSGANGSKARRHGANGKDLTILVPLGTVIRDYHTREILLDLGDQERQVLFLRGGRGGLGNWNFRSSTNQAPKKTTPGKAGQTRELLLEMAIIADIGLVGFPNAGKSSLLKVLTTANPKVADYPFTTLKPHLGVMQGFDEDLVLADIPGIIEGASQGQGLGIRFLKHINRTAGLAFCLATDDIDPENFPKLLTELTSFNQALLEKPRVIILTKADLPNSKEMAEKLATSYPDEEIITVSAHSHTNLTELKNLFWQIKKNPRL